MPFKELEERKSASKRYRLNLKIKERMSYLSKFHQSITDSLKLTADKYLDGEIDLLDTATSLMEDEEKAIFFSSISSEDLKKFITEVKAGNEMDIRAGKKVKSYSVSKQELKAAEAALVEAEAAKKQAKLNQKAVLAKLSNKALKIMETAHAHLELVKANTMYKAASEGSTPRTPDSPTSPSIAQGGEEEEQPKSAGGGSMIASAYKAITTFSSSSSSSEQTSKKARQS